MAVRRERPLPCVFARAYGSDQDCASPFAGARDRLRTLVMDKCVHRASHMRATARPFCLVTWQRPKSRVESESVWSVEMLTVPAATFNSNPPDVACSHQKLNQFGRQPLDAQDPKAVSF